MTNAIASTQIAAGSLWEIRDFTSSDANQQDAIRAETEQQSAQIESIGLGIRALSLAAANDELPTQT